MSGGERDNAPRPLTTRKVSRLLLERSGDLTNYDEILSSGYYTADQLHRL